MSNVFVFPQEGPHCWSAAEIKAQCKSQEFVRQVCFTTSGMHTIVELGEKSFTEKGKLRYFMIATFLLADTVRTYDIPLGVKAACLELLHARRGKIEHHMAGGYGPVTLRQEDVDDLDEITDIGIQLLNVERREAMAESIEAQTGMDLSSMRDSGRE